MLILGMFDFLWIKIVIFSKVCSWNNFFQNVIKFLLDFEYIVRRFATSSQLKHNVVRILLTLWEECEWRWIPLFCVKLRFTLRIGFRAQLLLSFILSLSGAIYHQNFLTPKTISTDKFTFSFQGLQSTESFLNLEPRIA